VLEGWAREFLFTCGYAFCRPYGFLPNEKKSGGRRRVKFALHHLMVQSQGRELWIWPPKLRLRRQGGSVRWAWLSRQECRPYAWGSWLNLIWVNISVSVDNIVQYLESSPTMTRFKNQLQDFFQDILPFSCMFNLLLTLTVGQGTTGIPQMTSVIPKL